MWRIPALAAVLCVAACQQDAPFYSRDIGVEAVPVETGALGGTFALKTTNTTQIELPGLEPLEGGGENFRLVERRYDESTDSYRQRSMLCGGFNYEVAGVTTQAPRSTYEAVPPSEAELVVVAGDGSYRASGHVQLWAVRDLPDGVSALPDERARAFEPPWDVRIYDMDADDNPGFTLVIDGGLGGGEVYAAQRKTVELEGITLGPDRVIGLSQNVNDTLTLGASNPLVDRDSEGSSRPHPDPKRSWFEEVRIPDGATCADVMTARDRGLLTELRPF